MVKDRDREIAFLQQALKLVGEYESVQQAFTDQQDVIKQATKNLAAAQKDVQNETDAAIKQRKNEISDEYNARMDERSSQIKKVKSQREKMRAEGVKSRIEMETRSLVDENKEIQDSIKAMFKHNKVPGFAGSGWFFTLFVTTGWKEYLMVVLAVILLLVALPILIYVIAGRPGVLWMVLIYIIDVLAFGGLYMLITNKVKVKYAPTIDKGRQRWDMILENRKKISKITKAIKKDQDDSLYGLQEFDTQLMQLEQDKRAINEERLAILSQFDSEGRAQISSEVQEKNRERLEGLQAELDAANKHFEELAVQNRNLQSVINQEYEPRFGKEFMTTDKLERLLSAYRDNENASLADAQSFVRSGKLPDHVKSMLVSDDEDEYIPDPSEIIGGAKEGSSGFKKDASGDAAYPGADITESGTGNAERTAEDPLASGYAERTAEDPLASGYAERTAEDSLASGYAEEGMAGEDDNEDPFGDVISETVDIGGRK